MSASHARQKRPLFPPAWSVKALADALHIDRGVIYSALKSGDLIAYRLTGRKSVILTTDVIDWIKSHRTKQRSPNHDHAQ